MCVCFFFFFFFFWGGGLMRGNKTKAVLAASVIHPTN